MIKQEVGENRNTDQQITQEDAYQSPVFSKKIEEKLARTLNNLEKKYSANIGVVKEAKKNNPNILSKALSQCLIDFSERPREVLINTSTEDQGLSFDVEMQGLTKQFANDYKGFTSNLSAEQQGQIRQDIQLFFDRRKLSQSHFRKILPQLTKQRFMYGVYFQDMILEMSRNDMREDVEAYHAQLKTLQQHHQKEEALLLEKTPKDIYFEYIAKIIERQYFPAYNTQQQYNNLIQAQGIPILNHVPEPYLSSHGFNPSSNELQRPPKLKLQSFLKIEEEYK